MNTASPLARLLKSSEAAAVGVGVREMLADAVWVDVAEEVLVCVLVCVAVDVCDDVEVAELVEDELEV